MGCRDEGGEGGKGKRVEGGTAKSGRDGVIGRRQERGKELEGVKGMNRNREKCH